MRRNIAETKPAFSVVVAVYNAELYLKSSLQSILDQTFPDFELLLVNDASTDRSYQICQSFAAADSRITVLNLDTNCGAAEARNQGIAVAKGQYLCIVDADDVIEPDYLKKFYDMLQENKYDFIKCGAYEEYFDAEDTLLYTRKCVLPEKVCTGKKEITEQVIEMEQIPLFGYLWNSVYKMSVVKENQLRFDSTLKVNEDFAFNMQYLPFVNTMKCLSYCGYHYAKRNNTSLSSQKKNYDYEKHLLKVRSFLALLKQNQLETQRMLDKVFWMFTRFTFAAIGSGTPLKAVRQEKIFECYKRYHFGKLINKQKVLTGILQSDCGPLIKLAACLMNFVRQNLPTLFARIKK